MTEFEQQERLRIFAEMVNKACGLSCWCFGEAKQLYFSNSPAEKEFSLFLNLGKCLDYAIEHADKTPCPIIMSDPLGMLWVSEAVFDAKGLSYVVIVGPVFDAASSLKNMEDLLRQMNFSVSLTSSIMEKMETVPLLTLPTLQQYIKMLHWIITGESLETSQVLFQLPQDGTLFEQLAEDESHFNWNPERAQIVENTIMQLIRDGNIHYRSLLERVTEFADKDLYNIGNPLRENKNTVLIFTALCTRAAIEGGLAPRIAKMLETHYIRAVEHCSDFSELIHVNQMMIDDFTHRVHACKQKPSYSRPIQEVCEYIQTHLTDDIELHEIAHLVGYTEYYLSKKFKQETGRRLVDYIKHARIQYACILLENSTKTIQEISEELHFSSRSYFSTVFQAYVGVSPAAFRHKCQNPNAESPC